MTRGFGSIRPFGSGYRASIYVNAERKRRLFPSKGLARVWLEQMRERKVRVEAGAQPTGTSEDVTLGELVPAVLKAFARDPDKRYAPQTLKSYASDFKRVLKHFGKHRRLRSITTAQLKTWRERLSKDAAPSTVRHLMDRMSQLQRFAVESRYLTAPVYEIKRPTRKSGMAPRATSEGELVRLLEAADLDHDRRAGLVLLFGADMGLRAQEMAQVRVGDVDLERLIVLVQSRAPDDRTKSGEYRPLPILTDRLREGLQRAVRGRKPPDRLLDCGSRHRVNGVIRRTWKTVYGKGPALHELRRRYASWEHRRGTPLDVIRQRLGHKDLKTTQGYLVLDVLEGHEVRATGGQVESVPRGTYLRK